jgi:hypothetical protein
MVRVEHDAAARDIGHAIEGLVLLDLHADRDALAVAARGLDAQQLGVVLAERILGLELHLHRVARLAALQRVLELREQLAVAAVQVGDFLRRRERRVLRVVELDLQ